MGEGVIDGFCVIMDSVSRRETRPIVSTVRHGEITIRTHRMYSATHKRGSCTSLSYDRTVPSRRSSARARVRSSTHRLYPFYKHNTVILSGWTSALPTMAVPTRCREPQPGAVNAHIPTPNSTAAESGRQYNRIVMLHSRCHS
jgi:hypothetical protein